MTRLDFINQFPAIAGLVDDLTVAKTVNQLCQCIAQQDMIICQRNFYQCC